MRANGQVPCVIYGGKENLHFSVDEILFGKLIYTSEVFVVKLKIGKTEKQALIQSLQFHPVTDKVIHADMIEVVDGKPVLVNLPVKLTGNSIGVLRGGKLKQAKRYLKVKASNIEDVPELLEIDIAKLKIGDSKMVGDLSFPKLELLDSPSALVVHIATARAAVKVDDDDLEEEESAEGEKETTEAAAE